MSVETASVGCSMQLAGYASAGAIGECHEAVSIDCRGHEGLARSPAFVARPPAWASRRSCSRRAPRRMGSWAGPICRYPCGCSAGRRRSCSWSRSWRCPRCGSEPQLQEQHRRRLFRLPAPSSTGSRASSACACSRSFSTADSPARRCRTRTSRDLHLRDLLGGHAACERAVRRHLQRVQPVADVRARGPRARGRAPRAALERAAAALPRVARVVAVGRRLSSGSHGSSSSTSPPTASVPRTLAALSLGYFLVMLAGMALFGIEEWAERADGFGVYFNLLSRLSPLCRDEDGVLYLRRPLSGITDLEMRARHGRADLHDHRHHHLRRVQQRRGLAQHRAEPRQPVQRPRPRTRLRRSSSPTRPG